MSRAVFAIPAVLLCALTLTSATVEKMSLDDMIQRSTSIVRGRVAASRAAARGPVIYTFHQVQVLETWKGASAASLEVATPGGVLYSSQQSFSGSPKLQPGAEYVFFIWTGSNGINHILGLSQGVLDIRQNGKGETTVFRPATSAQMIDASGRPVADGPFEMSLKNLADYVRKAVATGAQK